MTQQEIIAGNVEISQMMGLQFSEGCHDSPINNSKHQSHKLRYRHDWNWLMSAYNNFRYVTFPAQAKAKHAALTTFGDRMWKAMHEANIADMWLALSDFARWYNSLQTQNQ